MYMYVGFRTTVNKLYQIIKKGMFHVKQYFLNTLLCNIIFLLHSQRKESGIHIHSKRVYAATQSMFEITSTHSNARTRMYERVHTEPRWRIWTVAYYCLSLYMISYILLVAEYNECGMYMYDGLRTIANNLNHILKKECFT